MHTPVDPHLSREQAKYERPIASRELIMHCVQQLGGKADYKKLCRKLLIDTADKRQALKYRLAAMIRDKQLVRMDQTYWLISAVPKIRGKVVMQKNGTGAISSEQVQERWILSAKQMQRVMAGDEVEAILTYMDHKGKCYGRIDTVLKQANRLLVGQYWGARSVQNRFQAASDLALEQQPVVPDAENSCPYVVPFTRNHPVKVVADAGIKPSAGDFVLIQVTTDPEQHYPPEGHLVKVLGDHADLSCLVAAIKHQYAIPGYWPEEVLHQLRDVYKPDRAEIQRRTDYRHLPFVTIDGNTAKDFDDAVYCCRLPEDRWQLQVAIADVSYYVPTGSFLDEEAQKRGNSVYFPGSVEPMLPQKLSNDLCSLKAMQDRLVMVCTMTFLEDGTMQHYQFSEGVIRSRYRFTYHEVAAMLEEDKDGNKEDAGMKLIGLLERNYAGVWQSIENLYLLWQKLHDLRSARGALDFKTRETSILFDKNNRIRSILLLTTNVAHKMIEEAMLSANYCAADLLQRSGLPALYRVHQEPSGSKLSNLQEALKELSVQMNSQQSLQENYKKIMEQMQDQPQEHLVQMLLLRSLPQACYAPDNQGHFGLVYDNYTHFTSPIRRYADLLIHRAIKLLITQDKAQASIKPLQTQTPVNTQQVNIQKSQPPQQSATQPSATQDDSQNHHASDAYLCTSYPYDLKQLETIARHISSTERRADEATRALTNILKCYYLKDRVGEFFHGVISGITNFGFFVELADLFVEGLVHVRNLKNDHFQFNYARQQLRGDHTGMTYKLGDAVEVQLVRVHADEQEIDLLLATGTKA